MKQDAQRLRQPVLSVARRDVATLRDSDTVQRALDEIRRQGVGERIVYFYVLDPEGRLAGVLPTRRLLTAPLDQVLSEVMIKRVVAIPQSASVMEACEAFVMHRFLAFPVVDEERRIVGVVDVSILTEEAFDLAEREQAETLFESIGFRIWQVRGASPWRGFRFRFPWLLATIGSGTICALLAGWFELTLAKTLVLAFFLTLVLGLGESVSIQSMTVVVQELRTARPTLRWYVRALRRECGTAALLGGAAGAVVGGIAWVWRGQAQPAMVIGGGIALAVVGAGFFGLSVPAALHALRLDPKIAAGPLTLAFTDICTLLFYFGLAAAVL